MTTRIDPLAYRDQVESVPGRDPTDWVHAAACAFGGATVLLTRNERDFPRAFLAEHGVLLSTADDYLAGLLRQRPAAFLDVVKRLAATKQRPAMSPCDLATNLATARSDPPVNRLTAPPEVPVTQEFARL